MQKQYKDNVFFNCPFDAKYKPLFEATVFAVYDCGFVARCALEEDDGSQIRVQKIYSIISKCRLGIHDLSRVEISRSTRLPRFNMPLELGAFLGAKHFGIKEQKQKACLILEGIRSQVQADLNDPRNARLRVRLVCVQYPIDNRRDSCPRESRDDMELPTQPD